MAQQSTATFKSESHSEDASKEPELPPEIVRSIIDERVSGLIEEFMKFKASKKGDSASAHFSEAILDLANVNTAFYRHVQGSLEVLLPALKSETHTAHKIFTDALEQVALGSGEPSEIYQQHCGCVRVLAAVWSVSSCLEQIASRRAKDKIRALEAEVLVLKKGRVEGP